MSRRGTIRDGAKHDWRAGGASYDCAMRRNELSRAVAAYAVALAATLGLAACAPEAPATSATSTPAAVESPGPTAEPHAGDILSAEDAQQVNASWGRLTDDKAYPMPSGEWVLIKGNQPLPANVAQAVEAAIIPPFATNYASSTFDGATQKAANDARDAQEAATGRKTAIVIHGMNAVGASGEEPRWSVGGDTASYNGTSKDEAFAVAQAWVDQSPHTRILIVVDALG